MQKKWWIDSVGYQIYIKSFYDSNNDGIGDIRGIIQKLDYLHNLGINLIWLSPFYDSPLDDNGYDVRDYYKVHKDYGTLDDLKELIQKCHELDIKVIIDLVLNHTSDEHEWFLESRKSKDNPYRDYYIWKKGRNNKEFDYPTNWASFFGGSCFEYDSLTDEYYMKIFSKKMPDLNWKNPKVREEMIKMINFWIDLEIDGFRIDAVSHLGKSEFVDSNINIKDGFSEDWSRFSNKEEVHDYLKELYEKAFSRKNIITIGEVGGCALVSEGLRFSDPKNKELTMVFNFDHNWCNNAWSISDPNDLEIDLVRLKENFTKWANGFYNKTYMPIYWLNHDHPRVVSQYGSMKYHKESSKMLGLCLHFMWGMPFIYNGEEIGMPNYDFKDISDFNDVSVHNYYNLKKNDLDFNKEKFISQIKISSRDNARTPFLWSNSKYAGFSKVKPYMRLDGTYKTINAKDQENDKDSILNFYKKLIHFRRFSDYKEIILYGEYQLLDKDNLDLFVYKRTYKDKELLIICNYSDKTLEYSINNNKIINLVVANYQNFSYNNKSVNILPYLGVVFEVE